MRAKILLKGLMLMASLLAIGWGIEVSGLSSHLDANWIDNEIRGQGTTGRLIYLAIGAVAVAIGLPRQAVCFLGGYAFGLGAGLALAQCASILGCVLCFFYARLLARDLVRHKFGERLQKLDDFLHEHPMTMTMLIRFLPVGHNLTTTLLAGVSSVRALPFLAGSFIGYLPQAAIFVLLGSGIHLRPVVSTLVSVALFLVSAMLGLYLYRKLRHGHSIDASLDEMG